MLSVIASAAWFGLVTGFLELAILLIWHRLAIATVLGALQINRHFTWMIPLAQLGLFLICGLPLAVLAVFRRVPARLAADLLFSTLAFFALLSIIKGLYATAAFVLALGLGYQLGRWLAAHGGPFFRFQRFSLPFLLGGVAVLGGVAYDRLELEETRAQAALTKPTPGAPNVLLIVLDTVRADRLSMYGYNRDTTPNLARLAERGVIFSEARSAAPWTLPSHATLFTGRWPHELNVSNDRPLDTTYPTLAEFLAKHGYATAGFIGNTYFCNSWFGLARGFLHYEDYYEQNVIVSPGEALRSTALGRWLIRRVGTACHVRPETANTPKDAQRVNRDFLRWVEATRGRPFFAFLNYFDVHDPYVTPPGFDRHFGLKPESPADLETIRNWHHARKSKDIPERDATLIRDAYDDCLAALDEELGRLFAALEQNGVLRDTLVILTADHGEELGEHGLYGHGKSLYRRELHVPLLVIGPTGSRIPQGGLIAEPVSLRDVAATCGGSALGLAEASPLPGHSLARLWEPTPSSSAPFVPHSPVLSEVAVRTKVSRHRLAAPAMRGPMASLIVDGKVYIRDAMGREELYDLAGDPAETENLAGSAAALPALGRCRIALDHLAPTNAIVLHESAPAAGPGLLDPAHFVELEPWQTRLELRWVAVAEVDQEVRLTTAVGEELGVDLGVIEPRHWPCVEAHRTRGDQEIGSLQRGVAERVDAGELLLSGLREERREPRVGGKEPGNVFMKPQVVGDDGADRSGHRLLDVARHQRRLEPFLCLGRSYEHDPHRTRIGGGRPEPGQVVDPPQQVVVHRPGQPRVVGAGLTKDHVQCGVVEWMRHGFSPGARQGPQCPLLRADPYSLPDCVLIILTSGLAVTIRVSGGSRCPLVGKTRCLRSLRIVSLRSHVLILLRLDPVQMSRIALGR